MIINITPANSPYTLPASVFGPSIPETPNVTLRFSGGGGATLEVILPRVADLAAQQGTIEAIIMDANTGVQLTCSGTDVLSGLINIGGTTSISTAAGASKVYVSGSLEASVVTGTNGVNTWMVKKGFS